MMSRACLEKTRERLASTAFLRCMMFLNGEWPAMLVSPPARGPCSALAELEAAARLALAVLLALDHAAVAREEARVAQRLLERGLRDLEGARHAEAHRAALADGAAAIEARPHVVLAQRGGGHQRRLRVEALLLDGEVGLERPAVDEDRARAGLDAHARHRGLAAARAPVELLDGTLGHGQRPFSLNWVVSAAMGFCASCGWS